MPAVRTTLRIRHMGRSGSWRDRTGCCESGMPVLFLHLILILSLVLQLDSRIINAATAAVGICNFVPRMCHLRVWLPQNFAWLG